MAHNCNTRNELLRREDAVLVIIDVQEKLMPVISGSEAVIANAARLAAFCGIAGIPVIFTEQQKLGPTLADVQRACSTFNAIEKIHFNCFLNTAFARAVEKTGRKTLIIAGVESHICVAQTAIGALKEFTIHVVADAVSSRSPDNKQVAIERMRDAGSIITSTEMFMYEALVQAGTDEFRSVLPLVK